MFEWSCVSEGMAKEAIDATLCALCFAQPHFFDSLLEWFQVLLRPPLVSVLTDDSKVSAPLYLSLSTDHTSNMYLPLAGPASPTGFYHGRLESRQRGE